MKEIDLKKIPSHVAIIMDGNGRWAKKRNKPRSFGHREGAKRVIEIVEASYEIGIKYLSLFAFSTENWKRPEAEIKKLMQLLLAFIKKELKRLSENGVKLNILGDLSAFDELVQKEVNKALLETSQNDRMILNIALNYGSNYEILRACKLLCEDVFNKKLNPDDIDFDIFQKKLYTADQPNVDFLIRPSGEQRLSNFLLYQCSYAEIYFSNTLWPDFNKEIYLESLCEYQNRDRRFGGLNV